MADIKDQKLLYHLTDIANISSILEQGLLPRSNISSFVDVADADILESRKKLKLDNYVPFHFFGGSPFDGRVQIDNKDKRFVLITVRRTVAKDNDWQIIPKHPLADEEVKLLSYDDGFKAIDWTQMNARDYGDPVSKSVCMAECLSPVKVEASRFFSFYVSCEDDQQTICNALQKATLSKYVNINSGFFVDS